MKNKKAEMEQLINNFTQNAQPEELLKAAVQLKELAKQKTRRESNDR